MEKQYLKSEAGKLLNPPVLSKFNQLQFDLNENVYASKKAPIGCAKTPNIPIKVEDILSHKIKGSEEESVGKLLSISQGIWQTAYMKEFSSPPKIKSDQLQISSRFKSGSYDRSGQQRNKILLEDDGCSFLPVTEYMGNFRDTSHLPQTKIKPFSESNLLKDLWDLLGSANMNSYTHFTSYIKAYLEKYKEKISFNDFCKMFDKLGISVSFDVLKNILSKHGVTDENNFIICEIFLKSLNLKKPLSDELQSSNNLVDILKDNAGNDLSNYKTTSSCYGDHKGSVAAKPVGSLTVGTDNSGVIQPSVFENCGIYEDELFTLRSKEQVKCLFLKSGISFHDGPFNDVWNVVSKNNKASIMEVWNALKKLCLTENKIIY